MTRSTIEAIAPFCCGRLADDRLAFGATLRAFEGREVVLRAFVAFAVVRFAVDRDLEALDVFLAVERFAVPIFAFAVDRDAAFFAPLERADEEVLFAVDRFAAPVFLAVLLAVDFFAVVFLAIDLFAVDLLAVDLLAVDLFAAVLRFAEPVFFAAEVFFADELFDLDLPDALVAAIFFILLIS